MAGYGEARFQSDALTLAIELRALNNRYLKVSVRAPEPYNLLESEFEKVVRRTVRRGTVQITLRCERQQTHQDFRLNTTALRSYLDQLQALEEELGKARIGSDSLLAQILALPGVVPEPGTTILHMDEEWPVLERVLEQALARLQTMRQEEGRVMRGEFL